MKKILASLVAACTLVSTAVVPGTFEAEAVGTFRTNPHYPATRALAAPGAPIHVTEVNPSPYRRADGSVLELPANFYVSTCSQGPVGTVYRKGKKPRRVMFTAGHCLQNLEKDSAMRGEVYAPTRSGEFYIGYRDRLGYDDLLADDESLVRTFHDAFNAADWASVKLDPRVRTTNKSFSRDENGKARGRAVTLKGVDDRTRLYPFQVSADNFGDPICKDGARTGRTCGYQMFRTAHGVWSWGMNIQKGDSGGINYNPRTKKVVGISSMSMGPVSRTQPADRAIEDAYGIKSGTVNRHFKVTNEATPRARFSTGKESREKLESYIDAHSGTGTGTGAKTPARAKAQTARPGASMQAADTAHTSAQTSQNAQAPSLEQAAQKVAVSADKTARAAHGIPQGDTTAFYEASTQLNKDVAAAQKLAEREINNVVSAAMTPHRSR